MTPEWRSAPGRAEAVKRHGEPTLAVLPFDNLSGDPSQDFFSDGISEQLITVLSRFDKLRVLARNTTFAYKKKAADAQELGRQLNAQYIVEGSFRRVADQISVTAQLIDARTGTHVWAQTFDRPTASTSLLAIQDDIAQHIGATVGDARIGAVTKAELERTRDKPATELSSYECAIIAEQAGGQPTLEVVRRARACLEATVERDPTYPDAWASLPRLLANQRWYGIGLGSPEADDIDKRAYLVPRIVEAANRAVELAPQRASAHLSLFYAYWSTCQPERMHVEAERVLAINPNDANALLAAGYGLIITGDADYGHQLVQKAFAIAGPAAPRSWWGALGDYHYAKGEYAEAAKAFQKTYSETSWLEHMRVIATLPHLGRIDEARAEIPVVLKLRPSMSVHEFERFIKSICFSADFRERVVAALRLAGLREEADENHTPKAEAVSPSSQR